MPGISSKLSKWSKNMTNEKHKKAKKNKKYKNITWAAAPAIRTKKIKKIKKQIKNVLLRHTVGQNWGKVQKPPSMPQATWGSSINIRDPLLYY